jgi:hypothetical protein
MRDLLIPHYLLESSPEVVVTFLIIKSIFGANECEQNLITPEAVALFQYGSCKPNRHYLNKIKDNLKEMVKSELITQVADNFYIINREQLDVTPPFVSIEEGVFTRLMGDPKLLVHYLIIKKSRSYQIEVNGRNSVICCLPLEWFAKHEGVSTRTILRYNQQLEEAQLIYISRSKYQVNNECRELNVYSLYEDRDYANAYRPTYEKDAMKSNERRKAAALYNAYCKNPGKYSPEEKDIIRELIVQYNEDCLRLGQSQPDYLQKIKDIDVFDLF